VREGQTGPERVLLLFVTVHPVPFAAEDRHPLPRATPRSSTPAWNASFRTRTSRSFTHTTHLLTAYAPLLKLSRRELDSGLTALPTASITGRSRPKRPTRRVAFISAGIIPRRCITTYKPATFTDGAAPTLSHSGPTSPITSSDYDQGAVHRPVLADARDRTRRFVDAIGSSFIAQNVRAIRSLRPVAYHSISIPDFDVSATAVSGLRCRSRSVVQ